MRKKCTLGFSRHLFIYTTLMVMSETTLVCCEEQVPREVSIVKSAGYFYRGLGFNSQNHLQLQFQVIQCCFLASTGTRHVSDGQTYVGKMLKHVK